MLVELHLLRPLGTTWGDIYQADFLGQEKYPVENQMATKDLDTHLQINVDQNQYCNHVYST